GKMRSRAAAASAALCPHRRGLAGPSSCRTRTPSHAEGKVAVMPGSLTLDPPSKPARLATLSPPRGGQLAPRHTIGTTLSFETGLPALITEGVLVLTRSVTPQRRHSLLATFAVLLVLAFMTDCVGSGGEG